jgi:ABC-type multidrug transport system ATPase subunit
MYVRLAFAVAAHLEPEILIVDEVLAVGDAAFQKKCLGRMRDVAGEGRTVLFVSHNMDAVQKLCNTGVLLHKGKLITEGTINHVVRYYLDQHAAEQAIYEVDPPLDPNASGYIRHIYIETADGKANSEIPVLSPWRIRLTVRINRKLEHFITGFGISTLMEQPIRTIWSKARAIESGTYEISIQFNDVFLAPGAYKLHIGISDQLRTIHYIDNLATFEISDITEAKPDDRILNYKSGLILNQLPINILKIE